MKDSLTRETFRNDAQELLNKQLQLDLQTTTSHDSAVYNAGTLNTQNLNGAKKELASVLKVFDETITRCDLQKEATNEILNRLGNSGGNGNVLAITNKDYNEIVVENMKKHEISVKKNPPLIFIMF